MKNEKRTWSFYPSILPNIRLYAVPFQRATFFSSLFAAKISRNHTTQNKMAAERRQVNEPKTWVYGVYEWVCARWQNHEYVHGLINTSTIELEPRMKTYFYTLLFFLEYFNNIKVSIAFFVVHFFWIFLTSFNSLRYKR